MAVVARPVYIQLIETQSLIRNLLRAAPTMVPMLTKPLPCRQEKADK